MKSVKMFFGMMLCLVVLAGQAQATMTLDFEDVSDLGQYGINNGVVFTGWDGVLSGELGHELQDSAFTGTSVTASIGFSPLPAYLISFEYSVSTFLNGVASVVIDGAAHNLTGEGTFQTGDYGLASVLLSEVIFNLGTPAMLRIDNFSYTPTPLPGAAILLGSGLLGLIGLRRREII